MKSLSSLTSLKPIYRPAEEKVELDPFSMMNAYTSNLDEVDKVIRMHNSFITNMRNSAAAFNAFSNVKTNVSDILDVLSRGNIDALNKKLNIEKCDLEGRSSNGIMDVYRQSLAEDVSTCKDNLTGAITKALQQVITWCTAIVDDNGCFGKLAAEYAKITGKQNNMLISASFNCCNYKEWCFSIDQLNTFATVIMETIALIKDGITAKTIKEDLVKDSIKGKITRNNIEFVQIKDTYTPGDCSIKFGSIPYESVDIENVVTTAAQCNEKLLVLKASISKVIASLVDLSKTVSELFTNKQEASVDNVAVASTVVNVITKVVVAYFSCIAEYMCPMLGNIYNNISNAMDKAETPIQPAEKVEPVKAVEPEVPQGA